MAPPLFTNRQHHILLANEQPKLAGYPPECHPVGLRNSLPSGTRGNSGVEMYDSHTPANNGSVLRTGPQHFKLIVKSQTR